MVFNHILWEYKPKFGHFFSNFSPTQGRCESGYLDKRQWYYIREEGGPKSSIVIYLEKNVVVDVATFPDIECWTNSLANTWRCIYDDTISSWPIQRRYAMFRHSSGLSWRVAGTFRPTHLKIQTSLNIPFKLWSSK